MNFRGGTKKNVIFRFLAHFWTLKIHCASTKCSREDLKPLLESLLWVLWIKNMNKTKSEKFQVQKGVFFRARGGKNGLLNFDVYEKKNAVFCKCHVTSFKSMTRRFQNDLKHVCNLKTKGARLISGRGIWKFQKISGTPCSPWNRWKWANFDVQGV